MTDQESTEFHPSDVEAVARHWRKDWSDRSRSEMVTSKGPGFFLRRSKSDGNNGSGMYYTRAMVHKVITDSTMADGVCKLIDEVDHQVSVVVVLGFEDHGQAIAITVDKLSPPKEQNWFEMPEIRRRSLTTAVWVPLRVSEKLISEGKHGREGFYEEFFGLGSVMFPAEVAQDALGLEWSDIGISNNYTGGQVTEYLHPGEHFESKQLLECRVPFSNTRLRLSVESPSDQRKEITKFHPAGDHSDHRSDAVGSGLIIEQTLNSKEQNVWHLHQDFVVALRLMREGDKWLRPDEGYLEVARLFRDEKGEPVKLEVRAEQLRDYLCAKGMNLYLSSYRSRVEVCADRNHITWDPLSASDTTDSQRWEGRASEIHEGGMPFGATTAVFHAARTDVDDEEDVPTFGFPTDNSVKSDSWTKKESGRKLYLIEGELWRTEVIESGDFSERIRGDDPQRPILFIVDAAGNTESKETLVDGDSRWLWFKPEVMREILSGRGAHIGWYTQETGSIGIVPGSGVHFGINELGLINVYAKDIGLLTNWEQRKWAGLNVGPDGKVSKELLDSQMRAKPADTQAPEGHLRRAYDAVNQEFKRISGRRLFSSHQAIDDLFFKAHRFRALDRQGLLELAKDLARLTVESIDGTGLNSITKPPKDVNSGSIKHLEAALATLVGETEARNITGVFVGINELRQADAHLPSSDLDDSVALAGITETGITVHEAQQMLHSLIDSLYVIAATFEKA